MLLASPIIALGCRVPPNVFHCERGSTDKGDGLTKPRMASTRGTTSESKMESPPAPRKRPCPAPPVDRSPLPPQRGPQPISVSLAPHTQSRHMCHSCVFELYINWGSVVVWLFQHPRQKTKRLASCICKKPLNGTSRGHLRTPAWLLKPNI